MKIGIYDTNPDTGEPELSFPIPSVKSNGGHYDDTTYLAGMEASSLLGAFTMLEIFESLGLTFLEPGEEVMTVTIQKPNAPTIELMAMKHHMVAEFSGHPLRDELYMCSIRKSQEQETL